MNVNAHAHFSNTAHACHRVLRVVVGGGVGEILVGLSIVPASSGVNVIKIDILALTNALAFAN
jgi:hypothetical protein